MGGIVGLAVVGAPATVGGMDGGRTGIDGTYVYRIGIDGIRVGASAFVGDVDGCRNWLVGTIDGARVGASATVGGIDGCRNGIVGNIDGALVGASAAVGGIDGCCNGIVGGIDGARVGWLRTVKVRFRKGFPGFIQIGNWLPGQHPVEGKLPNEIGYLVVNL